HPTSNNVWERLYRACANGSWSEKFPSASVFHVQTLCSDHKAIHIKLKSECLFSKGQSKPWRFKAAWLQSPQCEQVVERVWRHPLWTKNLDGISAQLDHCREQLKGEDGLWVETDEGIRDCIESYFRKMYASNRPRASNIAAGTARLHPVVGSSMAAELLSPYTEAEITKALFQMASFKSPGPDDKIISPAQSAFYPGRLISDNILLAFELNHFLNTKSKRGQGFMALKLDVSKAYDKQAELEGRIPGVSICRGAPSISHLLFANDTLIFSSASSATSRAILDVLEIYRHASEWRIKWNSIWGFRQRWRDLRRTCLQLSGTESGSVFQGGMQSYYLNLPTTLLLELHGMVARFWWGNRGSRKIHWLSWDRLCASKFKGGLGFRQLHLFNIAILAKQLWRILKHPDCLLSKVLRARYFPAGDIFAVSLGWLPSFTWRSLMAALPLFRSDVDGEWARDLQSGLGWILGSLGPIRSAYHYSSTHLDDIKVSDLIDVGIDDILVWYYSSSGLFTVRSVYHLICSLENSPGLNSLFVNEHAWFGLYQTSKTHLLLCELTTILPWMVSVSSAMKLKDSIWTRSLLRMQVWASRLFLLFSALGKVRPWVHKLNFDGALLGGGSAMGLGVVAQNDRGTCLAWLSRRVDRRGIGEVAKALAAWEAIQLAARRGWKSLIIVGDCVVLINKLRMVEGDLSSIGTVLFDILALVPIFSSCHFACVKRKLNSVAH
ncbi:hypothetical protein Sango_2954200, partial [Sesamum angolense]